MNRGCKILMSMVIGGMTIAANSTLWAMDNKTGPMHKVFLPQDIKWLPAPDALPKGAQLAILEGDISKAEPFTMRLKMPAHYRIPPHWHLVIEHVTVLSGQLYIGAGDELVEQRAQAMPVNSFAYIQPEMHHFAFTHTPTTIQIHGVGPWKIIYVNPKDDPQNKTTG